METGKGERRRGGSRVALIAHVLLICEHIVVCVFSVCHCCCYSRYICLIDTLVFTLPDEDAGGWGVGCGVSQFLGEFGRLSESGK